MSSSGSARRPATLDNLAPCKVISACRGPDNRAASAVSAAVQIGKPSAATFRAPGGSGEEPLDVGQLLLHGMVGAGVLEKLHGQVTGPPRADHDSVVNHYRLDHAPAGMDAPGVRGRHGVVT